MHFGNFEMGKTHSTIDVRDYPIVYHPKRLFQYDKTDIVISSFCVVFKPMFSSLYVTFEYGRYERGNHMCY